MGDEFSFTSSGHAVVARWGSHTLGPPCTYPYPYYVIRPSHLEVAPHNHTQKRCKEILKALDRYVLKKFCALCRVPCAFCSRA